MEKLSIEQKPQIEKRVIKNTIESLKKPIEDLLEQLSDSIEKGEYQMIIGDDASGRIPTLIFNKVISEIYKEKDYENPKVTFFAGSKPKGTLSGIIAAAIRPDILGRKKENMGKYLDSYLKSKKLKVNKVLIVTDTISTGVSLQPLARMLKEKGIGFDIATIGFMGMISNKDKMEKKLGGNIYFSSFGLPEIYGTEKLGGITKKPKDVFSTKLKDEAPGLQSIINTTRSEANQLSTEIFKWYKENKKSRELRKARA